MSSEQNLLGQVAIISGGIGDIGRAIALELARRGADIALGDIVAAEQARETLDAIRKLGRRARYDQVDVSDVTRVGEWISDVEADLGVPTLIMPNAAIVEFAGTLKAEPQAWTREINVNLTGAFFMAQFAAKRLIEHKKPGRIVFTGSWAAHAPHPFIIAYSASKAALRMVCQCMAFELGKHDILVNEVAPGWVDAGLTGKRWQLFPEHRATAEEKIPIGKVIHPHDVAIQVAHLCDPDNKHMTGAVIVMDGGLSVKPRG